MPQRYSGAGRFRHLMQVYQPVNPPTPDAYGPGAPVPSLVATRHVAIEPLVGRELLAAQQIQADVTHRISMRYLAGVKPKWYGVYQGRTFNFLSVRNFEERNIELEILAKEEI